MSDVAIEYCVPCGFRERAVDVQAAILASLEGELDEARLVTGEHGVFQVRVDGEVVFDKEDDEYDVDGIVRAVREAL